MSESIPRARSLSTGFNVSLSLTALSVPDLVTVLGKSGARRVTAEVIQEDIDAGAPVNGDGSINLIEFVAWWAREASRAED